MFFVGPKGCGKSTTLLKVYKVMKEDHKVAVLYIDLKAETSKRLESLIGEKYMHYFIDNAQELARNDELAKTMRLISTRTKSVCCAFSPVVLDPSGCSLVSADIGVYITVYFTHFTDNELDRYVSTYSTCKLSKTDIQERTMNIPAYLYRLFAVSPPAMKSDIHNEIFRFIGHQLMYLRESYNSYRELVEETQNALITAVIFGCDSLKRPQVTLLVDTGFAYKKVENHGEDNASMNISLVYPKTFLLDQIESHVMKMAHMFVQFDKGAGFEFMFYAAAQRGIFVKSEHSGDEKKLPPVTDAWIQPRYGKIPDYFGPNYQGCLMVKLAEKHAAIDFVIADCSGVGVASRRLYLVQVSVQDYDKRKDRKYSAINQFSYQLHETPRECYTSKFKIQRWYYVYVSPADSTFSSVKKSQLKKFYSVHLKYSPVLTNLRYL